jgi:hypothetical protein
MDYGEVLRRTWQITWKYKGLWLLGILASCSGGGGGGGGNASSLPSRLAGQNTQGMQQFFNNIPEGTWIAIAIGAVLVIILLSLLFLALGILGQGGLIAGFNQAETGQEVTLGGAFNAGLHHFWRLLGAALLAWAVSMVAILIILGLGAGIAIFTLGIGLICLIPLICVMIPLAIAVQLYVMLTQIIIVIEDKPVLESFKRAWELVRTHVGPLVVTALILILGGGLVGLLISLPFIGVVIPAIAGVAAGTQQAMTTGLIFAGLCLVAYLPVMIVLNGVLTTYIRGAWTLTYLRLRQMPALASEPLPSAS